MYHDPLRQALEPLREDGRAWWDAIIRHVAETGHFVSTAVTQYGLIGPPDPEEGPVSNELNGERKALERVPLAAPALPVVSAGCALMVDEHDVARDIFLQVNVPGVSLSLRLGPEAVQFWRGVADAFGQLSRLHVAGADEL